MRDVSMWFDKKTGGYQFLKDGVPIDPFKEKVIYYNSSNLIGVAAEMGMVINERHIFVLDAFAGTTCTISFIRPHLETCDFYINLIGAQFLIATDKEMELLGKAWHIYLTELVKTRERENNWDINYIPSLMIPYKELEK